MACLPIDGRPILVLQHTAYLLPLSYSSRRRSCGRPARVCFHGSRDSGRQQLLSSRSVSCVSYDVLSNNKYRAGTSQSACAMGRTTEEMDFDSRQRQALLSSSSASRPHLVPSQPRIHWLPDVKRLLNQQRDNFTFTFYITPSKYSNTCL